MPALLMSTSSARIPGSTLAVPSSTCCLVSHVHRRAISALAGGMDLPGGIVRRLLVEVGDGDLRALAALIAISLPIPLAAR